MTDMPAFVGDLPGWLALVSGSGAGVVAGGWIASRGRLRFDKARALIEQTLPVLSNLQAGGPTSQSKAARLTTLQIEAHYAAAIDELKRDGAYLDTVSRAYVGRVLECLSAPIPNEALVAMWHAGIQPLPVDANNFRMWAIELDRGLLNARISDLRDHLRWRTGVAFPLRSSLKLGLLALVRRWDFKARHHQRTWAWGS